LLFCNTFFCGSYVKIEEHKGGFYMMANLGLGLISVLFIGLTGALVIMAGKILYRLVTGLYEEIHQY